MGVNSRFSTDTQRNIDVNVCNEFPTPGPTWNAAGPSTRLGRSSWSLPRRPRCPADSHLPGDSPVARGEDGSGRQVARDDLLGRGWVTAEQWGSRNREIPGNRLSAEWTSPSWPGCQMQWEHSVLCVTFPLKNGRKCPTKAIPPDQIQKCQLEKSRRAWGFF